MARGLGGRPARWAALWVSLSSLTALAAATACAPDAAACGGFFSRASIEAARRPSLSYEQTLIVFDEEKRREHFIREVAFTESDEPFGFVVPTPTRPEVAKAPSPFAALRADFPFTSPSEGIGLGLGGLGHGGGGRGTGVTVLEVKKVGSFTAFVLAADDERGLATWLRDNGLETTKEAESWLRHYVARKFFFVAMRYDPPAKPAKPAAPPAAAPGAPPARRRTSAETVRISFDTPLPFYPYLEPERPAPRRGDEGRLLEVWLVTKKPLAPIAARVSAGPTSWVRPLAEGVRYPKASRASLEKALGGGTLLPAGELMVQGFMDQKRSRSGYGDIVFVPREVGPSDDAHRASLRVLLTTLDPSLLPASAPPAEGPR